MTIGWEHPEDTRRGWEGINSADMEWFRDEPIEKFAREGVQNSLDARNDMSKPVNVKFDLMDVKVESIPDIKELRGNINRALEAFKDNQPTDSTAALRVIKLYENAIQLLSKNTIPVFQIIDSNTTGMSWDDDSKNSHFFTYMKATSHSGKGSDSGGSFGIGKMAPFVVSAIRTIFASSVYKQGNNFFQVTQGKAVFSSLFDANKVQRSGTGFWGEKGEFNPVKSSELIDSNWIYQSTNNNLTNDDLGTKISTIGFNANENKIWKYEIASSIIKNFFAAIHSNNLEVEVGDLLINSKSLNTYFKMENFAHKIKTNKNIDVEDWQKEFEITREYVSSLEDSSTVEVINSKLEILGECELRIKMDDDLPKRVCYIRNGMKITEALGVSGVKSFSGLMDFVAVFQCLNQKGNEILRSMENPSHNAFDPNRPEDVLEKSKAHNAVKELALWIRTNLNDYARSQGEEVKDIDELLEFFSWEEEEQGEDGIDEINPFGKPVKIKVKRATTKKLPKIPNPRPGPSPPNPSPNNPNPIPTPPNPKPGPGPVTNIRIPVAVNNFRFSRQENEKSLKLFFTPEFSGEAEFEIFKSEADSRDGTPLSLVDAKDKNTMIYIEGERTELDIELVDSIDGSLEIALFQTKGGKKS